MTKKNQAIVVGVVTVLILSAIGYVVLTKNPTTQSEQKTTTQTSSTSTNQSVAATITYSDSGFSPGVTTVKAGDKIAVKNISSSDLQFDSDPHPVHTDDSDLNAGEVTAGQTKTFTVNKTGTFGFHNHLMPGDKGTITVQ